jgi:hypothetical protein
MVVLLGCLGCGTPPEAPGESTASAAPTLTPAKLKRRGFVETQPRVWDTQEITVGELCDLIGCTTDHFSFVSGTQPGSELGPLVYDCGQVYAVVYHLREDTFTEEGWVNRTTPVRAAVVLYDETHPRPKDKVIREPGKKPQLKRLQ